MMAPDSTQPLLNTCPKCHGVVDVSEQEPYSKIECPHCSEFIRVRREFDHFLIHHLLGEGGMSRVFEAEDTILGRSVALKILNKNCSKDEIRTSQFEREAQLTASISHPNVIKVYSVGRDYSLFYIAMELVSGGSFENRIREKTRLPEDEVLKVGLEVSQGLKAAHEVGLIHRDIKPGNILFSESGAAKLVDFGLALMQGQEEEGTEIWATPYYVPPEKLYNHPEDFRSDMYSLGATLYHALTGRPTHQTESCSILELQKIKSTPVSLKSELPHASQKTCELIDRLLNVDPQDRHESYDELINDFNDAISLRHHGTARPWYRRPKPLTTLGGGIAASAALIIALSTQTPQSKPVPGENEGFENLALDQSPKSVDIRGPYLNARKSFQDGQYAQAITQFQQILKIQDLPPSTANWARTLLAISHVLVGESDFSKSLFQELKETARSAAGSQSEIEIQLFEQISKDFLTDPIPSAVVLKTHYHGVDSDSIGWLVMGIRHMQMGNFEDANACLDSFDTSQIKDSERWAWIESLKRISKDLRDDTTLLSALPKVPLPAQTPLEEMKGVLTQYQGTAQKLHFSKLSRPWLTQQQERHQLDLKDAITAQARTQLSTDAVYSVEDTLLLQEVEQKLTGLGETWKFDSALAILQDAKPKSGEGKDQLEDMIFWWKSSSQFLKELAKALIASNQEWEILRRSGPQLSGVLTQATEDTWTVQTGSVEIKIPVTDILPECLIKVSETFTETLKDSSAYYEKKVQEVAFARQTQAHDTFLRLGAQLAKENRSFRIRWQRDLDQKKLMNGS